VCPELLAAASLEEALAGADAAVVSTEWPVFREANWPTLLATMRKPFVLDANGFLRNAVAGAPGLHYHSVGQSLG
jgi:UDPglucose 6-dehydrogenase